MASTEERIQTFLAALPEGARDYYKLIFDIIEIVEPPIDEIHALGCFRIFKTFTITMEDGRAIGWGDNPLMGTDGEIAEAIAPIFHELNPDPMWWAAIYVTKQARSDVREAVVQLLIKLNASDKVKLVDQDFPY
jgi:hypothetical protein